MTEIRPLIMAVMGTALLSTLFLAFVDVNGPFMIVLSAILFVSIILTSFGYTSIGSWSTLIASLAILSILVFKNNGIRDTAVTGLFVVLIAAGLLAGKTGTIIIGSIILIEIGIYGALESQGVIRNQFSSQNNFSDYLALSITVGLITVLQWLVISRLNNTILKARSELAERKRIQAQLEEAEARYRGLVESIPLVTYMAEPGVMGKWHFISPQIAELTGFAPQEWINDPGLWYSRVHPDDRDRTMKDEEDALQKGNMPQLEYRLITRDDRVIWISDRSFVFIDRDTMLVQGFMLDITDRKLAEEQLTKRIAELHTVHGISKTLVQSSDLQRLIFETGEQIRLAFKANNVLIAIHDPSTNLIHFPYDFENGISRPDVPIRYGEGMTTQIMEMKHPLLIEKNWLATVTKLNAIHVNNLPVKSSFSVPIMTHEKVIGVITLENLEREYAFAEADMRPILTIASNLAVAIEKTRLQESIKQEMEIQEKLIRELEMKNEELERFTYTASHDLKSPLITIRGFLGYLAQDAREGNHERLNADIQRISDATEKMHRLLSELLELSKVGRVTNEKQEAAFDLLAAEALKRVEGQIRARQVKVWLGSGFPNVYVDRERIIEVIQNLVDNAVKFMGTQPEPVIEIDFLMEDEHPIFYVRDNGMGIKKEFSKRIFGLFDKLNPDTEGTGVGLALVKRIVEVHGGNIWVESEEGSGSTFYFTLEQYPKV